MTRSDRNGNGGLSVGTSVSGRYRIERELGRGGMATVYLARAREGLARLGQRPLGEVGGD